MVASAVCAAASCSTPNAVLLTVSADAKAEQYDLYLRDDSTGQIIFHSGMNAVQAPGEPVRDLTRKPLKIALKLSRGGRMTVLLVGVIGEVQGGKPALTATQLFWAGRFNVEGTTEVSAQLITVPAGDDSDRDLWPDAIDFVAHVPAAAALYRAHPELLDCDDKLDNPLASDGKPIKLKAADINPFTVEICGDGYDENCDGNHDEPCVDHDKDHDPSVTDCDDNDPKRHHATDIDPFPDPANCCGYSLGKGPGDADEHTDYLHPMGDAKCFASSCTMDKLLCPKQRCGDNIDESCQGKDTTCIVDEDCDGFPPPPQGNDCDDHDPTIHPGALEPCGSTKDFNCDGTIGEGCVPCDLDGDTFQRNDAKNNCPDANNKHPNMFDCNDYDASVFPGSTMACGGTEAGSGPIGRLQCSLKGLCRRVYESGPVASPTPKISSFGWLVGDADCNGTAYEGCPTEACDADGDGWPNMNAGCAAVDGKFDCNDADPRVYPGAPVSCGTGPAEDCTSQKSPCDQDADHDGYNAGPDCNDNDATIHPWAPETCNGKDDDCDGFVDEGNPDPTGAPMVSGGAVTACTDNNVGECGKVFGKCVCSISMEASVSNPADRLYCPGEKGNMIKPPHCFGAGQPHPQSCDATAPKDDDCDGHVDDVTGKNLAIKGTPCGTKVGQCKQGIVIGCDMAQVNCFQAFGRIPASQKWYVCSTDAVCPQTELCNGLDDDCDGTVAGNPATNPPLNMIPANDEYDHDGDGYMACSGCTAMLKAGLLGCGDCNDTSIAVHPGAPEKCDGINNTCDPGWGLSPATGTPPAVLDGRDECGVNGAPPNCCSGQPACRNLTTDKTNCTTCGNTCDLIRADQCTASGCGCSTNTAGSQGACTGQSYCGANGSPNCPTCNINKRCGPTCVDCTMSGSVCKGDGSGCTGCNNDGDCASKPATPYCNGGSCLATKPNDGAHTCSLNGECTSNHCADGYCCDQPCTNSCDVCDGTFGNVKGTCGSVPRDNPGANPPCSPYLCSGGPQCLSNCNSDADCIAADSCVTPGPSGTCRKRPGQSCTGAGDCASNICVNVTGGSGQVCCAGPCAVGNTCDVTGTSVIATTCNSGTCSAPSSPCGGGTYCSGGACTACVVSGHCGSGCAVCGANNSACVNPGTGFTCGCSSGANCSSGNYCAGTSCATCNVDAHCTSACINCSGMNGNKCVSGGSACGCGVDGDCAAGNWCSAPTCTACGNDPAHCGSSCMNCAGAVTNKACVNPGTGLTCGCSGNSDCGGTTTVCNTVTKLCVSSLPDGSPCVNNTDCANNNCISNGAGGKLCCNMACAPASSCPTGTSQTTTTTSSCVAPTPGTCSPSTANCNTGYSCTANACNTTCGCAGPCNDTKCATGYYCMATACTADDSAHCGNPLVNCATAGTFTGFACLASGGGTCGCTAATDCGAVAGNANKPRGTCQGPAPNKCLCGSGAACASGQCCNTNGAPSCGPQDDDSHCGNSCADCTLAGSAVGHVCVGVSPHCGCNNPTDCGTTGDGCSGAKLCTCKGGPPCTGGLTCMAGGCG